MVQGELPDEVPSPVPAAGTAPVPPAAGGGGRAAPEPGEVERIRPGLGVRLRAVFLACLPGGFWVFGLVVLLHLEEIWASDIVAFLEFTVVLLVLALLPFWPTLGWVEADDEGILISRMGRRRFITWQEIGAIETVLKAWIFHLRIRIQTEDGQRYLPAPHWLRDGPGRNYHAGAARRLRYRWAVATGRPRLLFSVDADRKEGPSRWPVWVELSLPEPWSEPSPQSWTRRLRRRLAPRDAPEVDGVRPVMPWQEPDQQQLARLGEAAGLFAAACGVSEVELRRPGFGRPGTEALTEAQAMARLGDLAGYLPRGIHDGVWLPIDVGIQFMVAALTDGGMWGVIRAREGFIICPDPEGMSLRVGCSRPCPDAEARATASGLTVSDSRDPLIELAPVEPRAADDAFWSELTRACQTAPIPFMETPATHVECWRLLHAADVPLARASARPNAVLRAYAQPLRPATSDAFDLLLDVAAELVKPDENGVVLGAFCLSLCSSTGQLRAFWADDFAGVEDWARSLRTASAIGVYPLGDDGRPGVFTATAPAAAGNGACRANVDKVRE